MGDDNPVPETLETIAARLSKLTKRFDAVDARFDTFESRITTGLADTRSELETKIDALHADVKRLYDELVAQS
jgi:hypothetical protein